MGNFPSGNLTKLRVEDLVRTMHLIDLSLRNCKNSRFFQIAGSQMENYSGDPRIVYLPMSFLLGFANPTSSHLRGDHKIPSTHGFAVNLINDYFSIDAHH